MADPAQPAPAGAPDDPLAEQTLDSELAYEGTFFQVLRDRVRCPDGHLAVREYIRHPGAVMIIAMTADGSVVLERQFRYPLRRSFIEMPAGKLEAGEDPLACAQRELLEETGYRAGRWQTLGSFHNAIGYSDERIFVYLARDLQFVGTAAEPGEILEIFSAPLAQLLEWITDGSVTDVKTIIGAHWLERLERLGRLDSAAPAPGVAQNPMRREGGT